ncbi:MAG: Ig-like domain-containing protein [Clostridiales bacterium]|nr:Ig-like domain-containing protein [Clostridiales bacterium]
MKKKVSLLFICFYVFLFTLTANASDYLVTASLSKCQIGVGETTQYTAVSDYDVTYSSSDESVATVDSTGLVTGISAGTSRIYATVTVGTRTQSYGQKLTVVSDDDTSDDSSSSTTGSASYPVANPTYTFQTTDGRTISTYASGYEATILLLGNAYCFNTLNTAKDIANSHWGNESNVRVVFADFMGNSKDNVEYMMNKYGSSSITSCYCTDSSDIIHTALNEYLDIAGLSGFSYPLIVYIDSNNLVRAITGDGYHSADEIYEVLSTFADVANCPSTPVLSDVSNTGNSVKVTWKAVSNVTGYYVYRKVSGGSWTRIGKTTSTSYTDTSVTSGVTYTYTVSAYDAYSESSYDTTGKSIKYAVAKTPLSSCSITLAKTSYVYSGSVKKPSVTVKYGTTSLTGGTDYTVSYSDNKNVGTATVTVKGEGNYSGTVKKTFTIVPKATSITRLKAKSKGFTVTWKLQKTQTTGYQLQYSTSKSFSSKTTRTYSNKTKTKMLTKLKKKTTYYVRIRTYKTVSGKKYYSSWSSIKKIKTK